MKHLKKYEQLSTSNNHNYGIYIRDKIGLIRHVDGYSTFNYYDSDDYNMTNQPDETQYVFFFNKNGDLTKITNYLRKNGMAFKIFNTNDSNKVSFYIKNETIKEYIDLLDNTTKYNI